MVTTINSEIKKVGRRGDSYLCCSFFVFFTRGIHLINTFNTTYSRITPNQE